jgi:exopolysaccharide biosynthesis polyprenyl glycosylphosphotransferase
LIDTLAVSVALIGAAAVRGIDPSIWHLVFAATCVITMAGRGAYARRLEDSLVVVLLRHVLVSALLATMVTVTGRALIENSLTSPRRLLIVCLVATAALGASRVLTTVYDRRRYSAGESSSRALIVGAGELARHAAARLRSQPQIGLYPVGCLDSAHHREPSASGARTVHLPILGGAEDLSAVVRDHRIDSIIVTYLGGPGEDPRLDALVNEAHEQHLTVFVIPRLVEVLNTRTRRLRLGTMPVDQLRPVDPRSQAFRIKYGIDRVIGWTSLVVLAPLLLAIAVAVRASSPGPVLFKQRRVGLDGREFDILKFRSMRLEVESEAWAPASGQAPGGVEGIDRRTSVGRFLRSSNLDELPQLINIAKGDMCIVGPRPERPEFVEQFSREFKLYDARHRVKAGLTGWSQVHGLRGKTSIEERAAWDNYYIENWSFALDVAIIVRTAKTFFQNNE